MATTTPMLRFLVTDLVKLNNSGEYIILPITNKLEFNVYNIMNIANGEEKQTNSYKLQKI